MNELQPVLNIEYLDADERANYQKYVGLVQNLVLAMCMSGCSPAA